MIRFAPIASTIISGLLFIAACSVAPERFDNLTPAACRAYGVEVPDGTIATGTLVGWKPGTIGKVSKECGAPAAGCAVPVEGRGWPSPSGQYVIWYAGHKCTPEHEACHAKFEQRNHTVPFNLRSMQGQPWPACPRT